MYMCTMMKYINICVTQQLKMKINLTDNFKTAQTNNTNRCQVQKQERVVKVLEI